MLQKNILSSSLLTGRVEHLHKEGVHVGLLTWKPSIEGFAI